MRIIVLTLVIDVARSREGQQVLLRLSDPLRLSRPVAAGDGHSVCPMTPDDHREAA